MQKEISFLCDCEGLTRELWQMDFSHRPSRRIAFGSEEQMLIYYWKVGDSLIADHQEMLLSLLLKEEVNH